MKFVLRYVLIIIAFAILAELNSGKLVSDIKGFFHPSTENIFPDPYIDTIPNEYQRLLKVKTDDNSKLSFLHTIGYGLSYPISDFIQGKQYYLQVLKISDNWTLPLKSSIKEYYVSAQNSGFSLYDAQTPINYSLKPVKPNNQITLSLKLLGKNTRVIQKNDSVAYYYSLFKNFSIQFNLSDSNIIYAEPKGNNLLSNTFLPLEILFIKRDHKLFLLTLSDYKEDAQTDFQPGLLYNLIKNK